MVHGDWFMSEKPDGHVCRRVGGTVPNVPGSSPGGADCVRVLVNGPSGTLVSPQQGSRRTIHPTMRVGVQQLWIARERRWRREARQAGSVC